MLKKWIVTSLLSLSIAAPALAMGPDMPMGKMGKWWHRPEVAQALSITDEEKKSLDDAYLNSARKLIDLKADTEKQMLELESLLAQEGSAPEALMKQFEQVQASRTQLASEHFRFLLESRKILGMERFTQLQDQFKQARHHHRKGTSTHEKRGSGERQGKGSGRK